MSKRKYHFEDKVLKVPKCDLPSLSKTGKHAENGTTGINTTSSSSSSPPPPLLLVQLPKSLSTNELSSSRFYVQGDKCRLISEEKGMTFDLIKVETSNKYILIQDGDDNDNNDGDGSQSESQVDLQTQPQRQSQSQTGPGDSQAPAKSNSQEARLLRENNTFFLECMPSQDDLQLELRKILKNHIYSDNSSMCDQGVGVHVGVTVEDLSFRLMHSKHQIQEALNKMKAFPIPIQAQSQTRYGMLSEEVERETWFVIVGVLSEWDGALDYAVKGVHLESMIEQVLKKNQDNNDHDDEGAIEEGVVRYCLEKCYKTAGSTNSDEQNAGANQNEIVKLSVDYIARILAHCLFNARSTPWLQEHFMEEWIKLMPGVGDIYEPKMELLKDIAIVQTSEEVGPLHTSSVTGNDFGNVNGDDDNEDHKVYLKYFPRTGLPSDVKGRFKALFRERSKWLLEDMEPYLSDIVDKLPSVANVQELLSIYAIADSTPTNTSANMPVSSQNEKDGVSAPTAVYYIAK